MMSYNCSTTLADDRRMRNLLRVNNIHDVVDHITCVLLQRVVHGAIKSGAGAVVVDAEPTANIDELHRMPHMGELGKKPSCFAYGPLNDADIWHLRPYMKMNQPQGVSHPLLFQIVTGCDQVGSRKTKLRVLAPAGSPAPMTLHL